MKLYEIIEAIGTDGLDVSYQAIYPYQKSIYTYYKENFGCEPVLMITAIFNAVQYCKVVPENEFCEALEDYVNNLDLTGDEKEYEKELINFNSRFFKDIIN